MRMMFENEGNETEGVITKQNDYSNHVGTSCSHCGRWGATVNLSVPFLLPMFPDFMVVVSYVTSTVILYFSYAAAF